MESIIQFLEMYKTSIGVTKDIVAIATFALTLLGFWKGYLEYKGKVRIERANFVEKLLKNVEKDKEIQECLYEFHYNKFEYNINFHDNMKIEDKVDKTLSHLTYVCYLYLNKVLSKEEFLFFELDVQMALNSDHVVDYLYNLYHFEDEIKSKHAFYYLIEYGKKYCKNRIDNDFFDKSSFNRVNRYHHILNFNTRPVGWRCYMISLGEKIKRWLCDNIKCKKDVSSNIITNANEHTKSLENRSGEKVIDTRRMPKRGGGSPQK